MQRMFNYTPTITSIKRSQAEQDALIKSGAPGVKNSPHLDWRAADIRLNDFPDKGHVSVLTQLLNSNFKRHDGLVTALAHGSGSGYHLHIQVPKDKNF